jgi:hypothetical protein
MMTVVTGPGFVLALPLAQFVAVRRLGRDHHRVH